MLLCVDGLRFSLCVEGYVFHFVLRVIRVSLCVKGEYVFHFVLKVTFFTLC